MTVEPNSIPEINTMEKLLNRVGSKLDGRQLRAAVVFPYYSAVLEACRMAVKSGYIVPIFIGETGKIQKSEPYSDSIFGQVEVIEARSAEDALDAALRLAISGNVDVIVRGTVSAPEFIRRLIEERSGFVPKNCTVSHVAVIKPEAYGKLLAVTDAAVNAEPDLKQKISLIDNLIAVSRKIGIESPRVAVLAAVEVVYPQMPVTLDAAVLSKMGERGQIKGAFIDGPLSFDCAIDPLAAESKGIKNSRVAGFADAMLAPNMETAHGIYKAMALYGRAKLGGVIYGGIIPVAMPATSDTAEAIYHSIGLACLLSEAISAEGDTVYPLM